MMKDFPIEFMANVLSQLQRHEGCIKDKDGLHVSYQCPAGKLTIGYGHNLDACPIDGINSHSHLEEIEALRILQHDVEQIHAQVLEKLPFSKDLDYIRYAVLINMAFNLGINGLCGFKTSLAFVEKGDYAEAAKHMLHSKWAHQVGKRARELAEQMQTGQWL